MIQKQLVVPPTIGGRAHDRLFFLGAGGGPAGCAAIRSSSSFTRDRSFAFSRVTLSNLTSSRSCCSWISARASPSSLPRDGMSLPRGLPLLHLSSREEEE